MYGLYLLLMHISLYACKSVGAVSIQEQVLEVKDMFCPGIDICGENSSLEQSSMKFNHTFWSCCTECNCRPNCTEENTCCFPPKELNVNITLKFDGFKIVKDCLFPTTIQQDHVDGTDYESFYMITAVTIPKNNDTGMDIKCGNKVVAPWGSMFPVFSFTKKMIYKNMMCAKAHGVTDGIVWDVIFDCKKNYNHIEASISVLELQTNDLNDCKVDFIPPTIIGDIKGLRCYSSLIDKCLKADFEPPFDAGLSKMDVIKLCESGFVSPFNVHKLYANVFCFICDAKLNTAPSNLNCNESKYIFNENRENYATGFIGLIDSSLIHSVNGKSGNHDRNPKICEPKNVSDCRPVLCPSGQIRDRYGTCKYLHKLWYNQVFVVNINLTSKRSFNVNDFNDISKSLSGLTQPLKKRWKIGVIAYELNQETRNGTSLLVVINCETSKAKPQKVMRDVKHILQQKWKLHLYNDTLFLQASISKSFSVNEDSTDHLFLLSGNVSKQVFTPIHRVLYRDDISIDNKHYITKLNFCKQIEIFSSEFISNRLNTIIFNTNAQKVLFNGEYIIVWGNSNRNTKARICIQDSGMLERKNKARQNTAIFCTLLVSLLVLTENGVGEI